MSSLWADVLSTNTINKVIGKDSKNGRITTMLSLSYTDDDNLSVSPSDRETSVADYCPSTQTLPA